METDNLDDGTSRFSLRVNMALRIIVNVSAIKSVLDIDTPFIRLRIPRRLPAGFFNSRDQTPPRQFPETDTA
jgi:hypothetical protein